MSRRTACHLHQHCRWNAVSGRAGHCIVYGLQHEILDLAKDVSTARRHCNTCNSIASTTFHLTSMKQLTWTSMTNVWEHKQIIGWQHRCMHLLLTGSTAASTPSTKWISAASSLPGNVCVRAEKPLMHGPRTTRPMIQVVLPNAGAKAKRNILESDIDSSS